jgi:hypothetical protein
MTKRQLSLLAIMALVVGLPRTGVASALSFKTYTLGVTTRAEVAKTAPDCGGDSFYCLGPPDTIAGVPTTRVELYFLDGVVERVRVTFSSSACGPVILALREKFGTPDVEMPTANKRIPDQAWPRFIRWNQADGGVVTFSAPRSDLEASVAFTSSRWRSQSETITNQDL